MVYFFVSSIFVFSSVIDFASKYYSKILLFFLIVFLIFFCSLRNEVGQDDIGYKEYFDATGSLLDVISGDKPLVTDRTELVEPLFLILASISKMFSNEVNVLFFFACSLSIGLRYFSFVKFSPYPILSFLIYVSHEYYVKDWIQIRSGLASSFVLFSMYFLFKKENVKFAILVLIASGFHFISLLAFLLFPLNKISLSKKSIFLVIVFSVALSVLFSFKNLLIFFGEYGVVPYRVSQYIFYEKFSFEMSILDPIILKSLFISFFCLFFYDSLRVKVNYFELIFKVQILATVLLLLFRDFSIMAVRANGLFYAVEPLLFALFLSQIRYKLLGWIMIVLYSLLWVYYDQFVNPFGIMNYKSIL